MYLVCAQYRRLFCPEVSTLQPGGADSNRARLARYETKEDRTLQLVRFISTVSALPPGNPLAFVFSKIMCSALCSGSIWQKKKKGRLFTYRSTDYLRNKLLGIWEQERARIPPTHSSRIHYRSDTELDTLGVERNDIIVCLRGWRCVRNKRIIRIHHGKCSSRDLCKSPRWEERKMHQAVSLMLAKNLEHREHPNWFSVKGSELVCSCRVNEPQIKWAWADRSGRYWIHEYRVAEVHQVLQVFHWVPPFKVLLPSKSSQLGTRGYHTCPWGHGTLAMATNKSPSLTPTLQIQTLVSLEDVGYLCDTDHKLAFEIARDKLASDKPWVL